MHYTDSHEWIRVKGKVGVVGISRYAQKELGEIVYIELPKVGATINAGEEAAVLESTKAAADIYSPVSGIITKVNENLRKNITLLNTSPEEEGWLFEMELINLEEVSSLLSPEEYLALIQ